MGDRMKVLKTICLIIFKLVLFIGVMCLLLSFSMKKLVTNSVSSIVVNNNETIQMLEDVGIEREKVQEFVENKKTQEFITSYINPIFEGNVDLENVNIGEDLYLAHCPERVLPGKIIEELISASSLASSIELKIGTPKKS